MYLYKPTNQIFETRKELKAFLGGSYAFNKAFKTDDILIINSIASYGNKLQSNTKGHYKN